MAENVLKIGRSNTFRFEGTVNVTDKTFVINKTNDNGTWVQNRMSLAIDCGEDGYNFVTLNGGYNPKGKNIIYGGKSASTDISDYYIYHNGKHVSTLDSEYLYNLYIENGGKIL